MRALLWFSLIVLPALSFAQETAMGFGAPRDDPDAPIEVTSEELTVSETDQTAVFTGNVVVVQDAMRLTAPKVEVFYDEATDDVTHMVATGGVTLVSGEDAAESVQADYDLTTDVIVMTGDVLVTRGRSATTGDRMDVDLNTNTAVMTGRVQTLLYQGDDNGGSDGSSSEGGQ